MTGVCLKRGDYLSDERLARFRKIHVVLLPYSGFSFSRRDGVGNVDRMCLSVCLCVGPQYAASPANYRPCGRTFSLIPDTARPSNSSSLHRKTCMMAA